MISFSSFRDPSGFLFTREQVLYRQINRSYKDSYDLLINSGLYEKLTSKMLLIPHEEYNISPEKLEIAYKVIRPDKIPFITYPYEWSFSGLKNAALLTLELEKISLDAGMTLKDASAYNVQFLKGKPIFIDTLSFERYEPGTPWVAYRQFCQHFLAPLALMQYKDLRLGQLLRIHIDGIPLDLAGSLLPKKTWLNMGILIHLHLHAESERKYADKQSSVNPPRKLSKNSLLGLLDNLTSTIENMNWHPRNTLWSDYYIDTNYSQRSFENKKERVKHFLDLSKPSVVWDLGANNGLFSRLAAKRGILTISCDLDAACVELNYRNMVRNHGEQILPLVLDLANPSPGIGWENKERDSMIERGPADTILALALIHHLVVTHNIPFDRIAEFFSRICHSLIIEYVPKTDSQVQKMLQSRKDIFSDYTCHHFEDAFKKYFTLVQKDEIVDSQRILYLWQRRDL